MTRGCLLCYYLLYYAVLAFRQFRQNARPAQQDLEMVLVDSNCVFPSSFKGSDPIPTLAFESALHFPKHRGIDLTIYVFQSASFVVSFRRRWMISSMHTNTCIGMVFISFVITFTLFPYLSELPSTSIPDALLYNYVVLFSCPALLPVTTTAQVRPSISLGATSFIIDVVLLSCPPRFITCFIG